MTRHYHVFGGSLLYIFNYTLTTFGSRRQRDASAPHPLHYPGSPLTTSYTHAYMSTCETQTLGTTTTSKRTFRFLAGRESMLQNIHAEQHLTQTLCELSVCLPLLLLLAHTSQVNLIPLQSILRTTRKGRSFSQCRNTWSAIFILLKSSDATWKHLTKSLPTHNEPSLYSSPPSC